MWMCCPPPSRPPSVNCSVTPFTPPSHKKALHPTWSSRETITSMCAVSEDPRHPDWWVWNLCLVDFLCGKPNCKAATVYINIHINYNHYTWHTHCRWCVIKHIWSCILRISSCVFFFFFVVESITRLFVFVLNQQRFVVTAVAEDESKLFLFVLGIRHYCNN